MTHSWGRAQGHNQQMILACSTGKPYPWSPESGSWGTGTGLVDTDPEKRPGIRRTGSVLGLGSLLTVQLW